MDALFSQSVFGSIRALEDLFDSFFRGLIAVDQVQMKAQKNHAQSKQFGEQKPGLRRCFKGLEKRLSAPLASRQASDIRPLLHHCFFLARQSRTDVFRKGFLPLRGMHLSQSFGSKRKVHSRARGIGKANENDWYTHMHLEGVAFRQNASGAQHRYLQRQQMAVRVARYEWILDANPHSNLCFSSHARKRDASHWSLN